MIEIADIKQDGRHQGRPHINPNEEMLESLPSDWRNQSMRMIGLINIARTVILFAVLIFSTFLGHLAAGNPSFKKPPLLLNENTLLAWCALYGMIIMFGMGKPEWQIQKPGLPNASSVVDITMMAVLTHLGGGTGSGLGILMLPFLATSCLLSYGRWPLLYGGYAALWVMGDVFLHFYPFDIVEMRSNLPLLTAQILLIAACYIVPLLTSFSAAYLASAGDSVRVHRSALARLTALNKIVLNRVQEAVLVLDTGGRVWLTNRQTQQLFPGINAGDRAPFADELVERWRTQPQRQFETITTLNQERMHVRAIPMIHESVELLMLFIRSDQERQAEAQTVKLTSLGMLTANLAHELRNPLSALRQAGGLLAESAEESGDKGTVKLCGMIEKNVKRVDKMIEEVSLLNKRDRINTEDIRLMRFCMNFVQEFFLTKPESEGCLKLDLPPKRIDVSFDAMHLQQILWNLCNNAWRHSKKTTDSVIIIVRELDIDRISLRVWDDGPGVPEDIQPLLFEPFRTTQSEGTGLGLYVARELAHANRGDLRYIPKAKCFELILPRSYYD